MVPVLGVESFREEEEIFVKSDNGAAGAGKILRTNSKEVFLRLRILFFCNLKCAIASENALLQLQLKPFRIVGECREFEQY